MRTLSVLDEDWKVLTSLFPAGWKRQAHETGAIQRLRGFNSAEGLLRTLLLHVGLGYSLRETAVRAKAVGLAEVSDVALLQRLKRAEGWLHGLCLGLLRENGCSAPAAKPGVNLRIVDGTIVKEPGKTGSQWRIHFSLQLPSLECDYFKLLPTEGVGRGETFRQFPLAPGDFVMGDAGYSQARGIEYVTQAKAYVMVRLNSGALPLFGVNNQPFPLINRLKPVTKAGSERVWKVLVKGEQGLIPGRICVLRKSEQAIAKAHRKLLSAASKRGRTVKPETLEYAKFVIIFTTFPESDFTAAEILDWYRLRWQIELVFKRLKTLTGLGHLPKYDAASSRAWLYGKLFVALLTQKLIRLGSEFSPWGYQFQTESHAKRLA